MFARTAYSLLLYLLAPAAVGRLLLRSGSHAGYRRNIHERFGICPPPLAPRPLWVHAVSVGEVIASEPLIRRLRQDHPQLPILVTTTTPTGAEQLVRSFGTAVAHCYAPYDLPDVIERFLRRLNPRGLVIMETELWPNWAAAMRRHALPVLLINGRLSEKSAHGYRRLGPLARQMFADLSAVGAQTAADAARFTALGARPVQITGNLKADFHLDESLRQNAADIQRRFQLPPRDQVIVAASTHPGEDASIIRAFAALHADNPQLRLLLVPRHPERAASLLRLLNERRLGALLRSAEQPLDNAHPVLVCDKLGELRALYGTAAIALIGGTLVEHGGHNPLEPAAWGLALLAGPSQRNFDTLFQHLEHRQALLRVAPQAAAIQAALQKLLDCPVQVAQMGQRAQQYLAAHRGATDASIRLLRDHIFHPTGASPHAKDQQTG